MTGFHVVAANLIENDGEYLLVQEGKEEVRGLWNLPAGGVRPEEDIKEAAIREGREETGLKINLQGFIGVFVDESDRSDVTVLIFVFHSHATGETEVPEGEEILDVQFFYPSEFGDLDIRIPFLEEAVKRYEGERIQELETVKDFRGITNE